MARRCRYCGTDNIVNATRCKKCGARLNKICVKCGTDNEPTAKFCKNCGWPLTGPFSKTTKPLCARCHSPVEFGSSKCPSCGAHIDWGT